MIIQKIINLDAAYELTQEWIDINSDNVELQKYYSAKFEKYRSKISNFKTRTR